MTKPLTPEEQKKRRLERAQQIADDVRKSTIRKGPKKP